MEYKKTGIVLNQVLTLRKVGIIASLQKKHLSVILAAVYLEQLLGVKPPFQISCADVETMYPSIRPVA
jgi:hypothetical protein